MAVSNTITRYITDVSVLKIGLTNKGELIDLTGLPVKMSVDFTDGKVEYTGTILNGDPDYNVSFTFAAEDVLEAERFTYDIEVTFNDGKLTFVKDILNLISKGGDKISRFRGDTYRMEVGIVKDKVLLDLSLKTTYLVLELSDGNTKTITGTPITGDPDNNVRFEFVDSDVAITGTHTYTFKDSNSEIYARNDFILIQDVTL